MDTSVRAGDRFGEGATLHATPAPSAPAPFPGTEDVDPREVFATPGYTGPRPPSNQLAQVAPWLAAGGFLFPPLFVGGIVLGVVGLVRSGGERGVGRHAALAGVVVSVVGAVLVSAAWILGTLG